MTAARRPAGHALIVLGVVLFGLGFTGAMDTAGGFSGRPAPTPDVLFGPMFVGLLVVAAGMALHRGDEP